MSTLARLDARKRLNLAPYVTGIHTPLGYAVTVEPSGRIVLEPLVVKG